MKKWLTILFASLLVFVLAACNSSSESGDDKSSSGGDKAGELSLEDVYKKALDRQNEIKSMSADVKMDMKMAFDLDGQKSEETTTSTLKMDLTLDPVAVYMKGDVEALGEKTNLEAYMVEDGMYMYETTSGSWMKFPMDDAEQVLGLSSDQINSAEQIKELEAFIEDFKIEEKDNEYILTLSTASDKFTKYVLDEMQLNDSLGLSEEEKALAENIKFDKVNYVIKVQKDTFDITAMDMVLDMTIEEDGQSMKLGTDIKMTYSNFDGVKEIKVPQEAIDNAVELSEDLLN